MSYEQFYAALQAAVANGAVRNVDIAHEAGVSTSAVSQWLNGSSKPSADKQERILAWLDSCPKMMPKSSGIALLPVHRAHALSYAAQPPVEGEGSRVAELVAQEYKIRKERTALSSLRRLVESEILNHVENQLLASGCFPIATENRMPVDFAVQTASGETWAVEVKLFTPVRESFVPALPHAAPLPRPLLLVVAVANSDGNLSYYSVPLRDPTDASDSGSIRVVQIPNDPTGGTLILGKSRYALADIAGISIPID